MPTTKKPGNLKRRNAKPVLLARPKDRRETEASLFAAGVQVMSSRGYEGATTKRIAEIAGVNEQLISRYFGGKEGLLVAIMESYKRSEFERELAARPEVPVTLRAEIVAFLAEADFSAQQEPFARLALGRAIIDEKIAQTISSLCTDCYRPLLQERLKAHRLGGAIDASRDIHSIIEALIYVRLGLAAYGRMLFHLDSKQLSELCNVFADVFTRALGGDAITLGRPKRG